LNAISLRAGYDASQDEALSDLDALTTFIGNPDADMQTHIKVSAEFLLSLWKDTGGDLRTQRATGLLIAKLIRVRDDWPVWLGLLVFLLHQSEMIVRYIFGWSRGHFLPSKPVDDAFQAWRFAASSASRRR
jgi:hypothetical protein